MIRGMFFGALVGLAVGLWLETDMGVLELTFDDMLHPEDWAQWDGVPRR